MERDYSSLGQLLFDSLQKYGNEVLQFITETEEVNTYADILSRSVRTALRMKKMGISRKDIISTCTHNHKDSWVPFIASQLIGSVCSNYDPNLSHLDTIHLLKQVEPRIIFVSEESLNFIETCIQKSSIKTELVVFGNTKQYSQFSEYVQYDDDEQNFIPEKVEHENDTALIAFTSGTTGSPKGTVFSHRALVTKGPPNFVYNKNRRFVKLLYHTMYWKATINNIIECIYSGSILVTSRKFDAAYTWKLIKKYKITSFFMQPCYAIDFINTKSEGIDISSLSSITIGGWNVTKQLMQDMTEALPTVRILQVYGQTEGPRLTMFFGTLEEHKMQILKPESCGKVVPHVEWKIVDIATEKRLGANQQGELRIKSKCQMDGYYKMDFNSAFDTEGYFKTGDILYYDEDGCFYVVDRVKEMFKYRTWHISPAVLEAILKSYPSVKEAAVIGIPSGNDGDHPMGLVTLIENALDVNASDIENFVNERVSDYQKLRGGVKIIESIPKTVTGKIQRQILKEMILTRHKF